jgi:hypothetical protein
VGDRLGAVGGRAARKGCDRRSNKTLKHKEREEEIRKERGGNRGRKPTPNNDGEVTGSGPLWG